MDITLEEQRLLSEAMLFFAHMDADGQVPPAVFRDVKINKITGVQEIAMPGAVSRTFQKVEYNEDTEGRQKRVFKWLGMSAIEVAQSGADFYASEAGRARGEVEIAEARFSQDTLQPGRVQGFISPKMSRLDAPEYVAKEEHLHSDDSIRVSRAVTDASGSLIGRQMESLLVSDVPLDAWVRLLQDPNNPFGKTITVSNERSALAVMEIFQELEAPEALLPEGPVSIVAAVLPHIHDPKSRQSVVRQLEKFRGDQKVYEDQAEKTAQDWLEFDLELARSLKQEVANASMTQFIHEWQLQWSAKDLQIINSHWEDGYYRMTPRLAAVLESAKQYLLAGKAAILTKNEKVLGQMDAAEAEQLYNDLAYTEIARTSGIDPGAYRQLEAQNMRGLAAQNLSVEGGCPGGVANRFRNNDGLGLDAENNVQDSESHSESSTSWTWKRGVCRVDACTSPQPTEVGPCSVCRNCQHMFDRGIDPTKIISQPKPPAETASFQWLEKVLARPPKPGVKKSKIIKENAVAGGGAARPGV